MSDEADDSRIGPTILWSMLKGKKVVTNDGKEIGEIKEVSDNYIRLEKGTIKKDKFWIPKYLADAYDGKTLWLLIGEDDILNKYHHGSEPAAEQYTRDFEAFKGTSSGQKAVYPSDYNQNVRVVDDYKNVRELK